MSLPPGLVGESVEDAESGFSEADRKPRDRCRFLLDQRKTAAKKVLYVCLFPGLCFQSNPQSEFYCISHGFLLRVVFRMPSLGCLGSDECYISNRFETTFSCGVRVVGLSGGRFFAPFWKRGSGVFPKTGRTRPFGNPR